jgi:uncharacterized protein YabE (DUF348 family)
MIKTESRLRYAAAGALMLGLLSIYLFAAREVSVVMDGAERRARSHARSVGQVLEEMGINLTSSDEVMPAPETLLSDLPSGSIEVHKAFPAILTTNGFSQSVMTTDREPLNILLAQGLPVFPADRVWIDGIAAQYFSAHTPQRVELAQAVPFLVVDGGTAERLKSSAATIGQALHELGVPLFEGDQIAPDLSSALIQDMQIEIDRSRAAQIIVDNESLVVRVRSVEVGEALSQVGITLQGLDYAVPDVSESIPSTNPIRVIRVSEKVQIEQEPLPFSTTFQPIPELEIDNQQLPRKGSGSHKSQIQRFWDTAPELSFDP